MASGRRSYHRGSTSSANASEHSVNQMVKVQCQMCDQSGHTASECKWVYSSCISPECGGMRMFMTSKTTNNPDRKYLRCQFGACRSGIQWLDEVLLEVIKPGGCFKCGEVGHWLKDCPWSDSSCIIEGCKGKRSLRSSQQQQTLGWKYLKCYTCGDFQWLKDAVKLRGNPEIATSEPTVSINMTLSDFCNAFDRTRM